MPDLEKIRADLTRKLDRLSARVDRIERDLRAPATKDFEEQAIESENDEVLERLDEAELEEIQLIRGALQRLDEGTYGTCTACGEPIAEKRLEALPYTARCIDCAE